MARSQNGLNKAQKERIQTYLSILEVTLPHPIPILSISERTQKRLAMKYRNYRHAIELVKKLVNASVEDIDFKSNKQYNYNGETLHVHRKGKQPKIRKISKCQQLKTA